MQRVSFTPICLLVAMVGAIVDIGTELDETTHPNDLNLTRGPKIYYLHIKSDVRYRFATTVVTSKIVNPDSQAHQTTFQVTLPNEAFITNFTLTVRNQTYAGEVKTKEAARQEYKSAVSKGKTAAHIAVRPRETNMFNIDVNVAAEEKLTFELRYQELLQRKLGAYNHLIYVKPGEPVADMRVDVDIFESRAITNLQVPPIRNDILNNIDTTSTNELAVIEHRSNRNVHIRYQPSLEQQGSEGIDGQFTVSYDVERQTDGGDILMVNGYFVHFFSPSGLEPRPKDIVFILDKSASMGGTKIRQLREAMLTILSQIDPADKFNIIAFASQVTSWRKEQLVSASETAIQQAKEYVNNISASGATNIKEAMLAGISQLESRADRRRPAVIIFLTDGEPTSGEINSTRLLSIVEQHNEGRVPVFSLAFGRGADFDLVKRMAIQNNGFGRKIYEDSDASLQISNFYSEVSTVLLKDVTFNYLDGTVVPETIICDLSGLYKLGSELVVSGRVSNEDVVDLQPHVTGIGSNGLVDLVVPDSAITTQLDITQNSDIIEITEKLWAYLTIKQWIRQMEASTDQQAQESWKRNITEMALKYHFVTALTSMVVTLPDELQVSPVNVEEDEIEEIEEDDITHVTHAPTPAGRLISGMFRPLMSGHQPTRSYAQPESMVRNLPRSEPETMVRYLLPRLGYNPKYGSLSSWRYPPMVRVKNIQQKRPRIPAKPTRIVQLTSTQRQSTTMTVQRSTTTPTHLPTTSTVPRSITTPTHLPTISTVPRSITTPTYLPNTTTVPRSIITTTYLPNTTRTVQDTTNTMHTSTPTTTTTVQGPHITGTVKLTTRAPVSKKTIRIRTKASDYTLIAVKGVNLPLCFRNPGDSSVDTTTMYNLTMDPDTGRSVSVGYTFYGSSRRTRTRITRIIFRTSTNATTEIIPGFRIEEGVRKRAPVYSVFRESNNLNWEVVNKKNKLTLLADFTGNTKRNMEGSLVIPVQGVLRGDPHPTRNQSKAKLVLNVEKGGSITRLKTRVKYSKPMQCWVTKRKHLLKI